ncbi:MULTISPECIES: hypothetical protein [Erysipelotrichaceae]|jgi:hypothetical protein|uniref:hypothetical protein n=1 Tax=Erysipelotrichaceae TaxID=128827 RepID=UPI000E3EE667|nr:MULTISPECIES: hypothetical protein [unclassified Absiella]RGB62057.1 hypothetical protein DW113_20165 [Absiella sp. AM09-45]RGB71140.1 hypothetical protein DW114_20570 [Absiella sp. AM09-50]RGC21289.1 hypothetical protein DXA09_11690 [Absiella sp. AM54-8XD]RHU04090.1 hypothetical protein DW716_14530 [Absiella sp. AM27-20]
MDKKAKNILMKTYWSASGWKDEYTITPKDFTYAKEKGLMFDAVSISHDKCVKQIKAIVEKITPQQIVKAFISSLSSRRLDWRSGISSYYIAKMLPMHTYTPVISGKSYENGKVVYTSCTCSICKDLKYGVIGKEYYKDVDVNILNFERIKWGGVRHGELIYILFDLQQFIKEEIPEPTDADIHILKDILKIIMSSAANDHPGILCDRLKDIPDFKSNKNERSTLVEILACIGVLKPQSYERKIQGKNDWTFVEYWRGEDGCDQVAVNEYFGEYL